MRAVQIKAAAGKLLEGNLYKADIRRFAGGFVRGEIFVQAAHSKSADCCCAPVLLALYLRSKICTNCIKQIPQISGIHH